MNKKLFKQYSAWLCSVLLLLVCGHVFATTPAGTVIDNSASANFDLGTGVLSVNSNTVSTVTVRTAAEINFYNYTLGSPAATLTEETPTQCFSNTTAPGSFIPSINPEVADGVNGGWTPANPNAPLPLAPLQQMTPGDSLFITVTDLDQNLDGTIAETIEVTVSSNTGDQERLILTETDVNTGQFIGYVQTRVISTSFPVTPLNCVLTVALDDELTASYTDEFDGTDIATESLLVDPFGIVFDSRTGVPVDGIQVDLLNATTNAPAAVFDDNGNPGYPSTFITGQDITVNGIIYDVPTGGFRFPLVAPGQYILQLTIPSTLPYSAPSIVTIPVLQTLAGGPFVLDPSASYGGTFPVPPGDPVQVDIPVDPIDAELIIDKSVSSTTASVGDFVQYTITVENVSDVATAVGVDVTDILPQGFRYEAGSAKLDSVSIADPVIDSTGIELEFAVNNIAAGQTVTLTYVVNVGIGAKQGKAINRASAQDDVGVTSNIAQAVIQIGDELMRTEGWIVGRVIDGDCSALDENLHGTLVNNGVPENNAFTTHADAEKFADKHNMATTGKDIKGLANATIYLEDGQYVVTDEEGKYHFEGLRSGNHVVQLDKGSLPTHYEVVPCERNTRFAGRAYSRFVDLQGGSLWRADFYVREKPPLLHSVSLQMQSKLVSEEEVEYTLTLDNAHVELNKYRLTVLLPDVLNYQAGSSALNGKQMADPKDAASVITYRIDALSGEKPSVLTFKASLIKPVSEPEYTTTAYAMFNAFDKKNLKIPAVANSLLKTEKKVGEKLLEYTVLFDSLSAQLNARDNAGIDKKLAGIKTRDIQSVNVTGHADSRPVQEKNKAIFTDNQVLSDARAKSVADKVQSATGVDSNRINATGGSDTQPVASNKTDAGRAQNRRAELQVTANENKPVLGMKTDDSGQKNVFVKEPIAKALQQEKFARPLDDEPTIDDFDLEWLNKAEPGVAWLLPTQEFVAGVPAISVAIKHHPKHRLVSSFNGNPINPLLFFGKKKNNQGTVARSYWQGISLRDGNNTLSFEVWDGDEKIQTLNRIFHYAGMPVKAELVEEYTNLIADGKQTPQLAVKLFDADGYPARPGTIGSFKVNGTFTTKQETQDVERERILGIDRNGVDYIVGPKGIAIIEFEPTTQTGRVEVEFDFSDRKQKVISWMQPKLRDWILVGLADTTLGYNNLSGNMTSLESNGTEEDFYDDGRVAFFAKGRVKGEWLLTTSYDTDKPRLDQDNRFFQVIDPDEYFTLYGDATEQRAGAASSDKLYIKMERKQFYALYGDFDTGMTLTELSKYSRTATGLKMEYAGNKVSANAFAFENRSQFVKDEIQGDGTSGLYQLSNPGLLINSEKVILETRDRFRNEDIIDRITLRRHLDYNIDYSNGTLFFKKPINSRDAQFNPIFIVADYEVDASVDGDVNAGGRIAIKPIDSIEIGVSGIHDSDVANETNLMGTDVTVDLSESTQLTMEYAQTDSDLNGTSAAYLAELEKDSDDLTGRVYYREQEAGFGVGQQSSGLTATRKYGVDAQYRVDEDTRVNAQVFHEDLLSTDAKRDVIEADVEKDFGNATVSAGLRHAADEDSSGQSKQSNLVLLGGSLNLNDNKLKLRVNTETAVGENENIDYPSRYIVGADYQLSPNTTTYIEHEITDGDAQDTHTTRAGLRTSPWANATADTAMQEEMTENGLRTFATFGLTQDIQLSDRWSMDAGVDHSRSIKDASAQPFNSNATPVSGASIDYTAVSMGVGYSGVNNTFNSRLEYRHADTDDKLGVIIGWYHEQREGIGYGFRAQLFDTKYNNGLREIDGDARFSLAYRPISSDWIHLNRLDYFHDEKRQPSNDNETNRRFVNNWRSNYLFNRRNQIAMGYGVRYVLSDFDNTNYDSLTQFASIDYRRDITDRWDIGIHAAGLFGESNTDYAVGIETGWDIINNLWLSVGYNFEQFNDDDFNAAEYSADGVYLKLRFKFDQDTFRFGR